MIFLHDTPIKLFGRGKKILTSRVDSTLRALWLYEVLG